MITMVVVVLVVVVVAAVVRDGGGGIAAACLLCLRERHPPPAHTRTQHAEQWARTRGDDLALAAAGAALLLRLEDVEPLLLRGERETAAPARPAGCDVRRTGRAKAVARAADRVAVHGDLLRRARVPT